MNAKAQNNDQSTSLEQTACFGCLKAFNRDDTAVTYDGRDVCWFCVMEGFLFCTSCGLLFDTGIMLEPGDGTECLCPDCVKKATGFTLPKHQLALAA